MSAVYCFWLIGAAGLFMWMPAIIKSLSGRGVTYTGYISTTPYIAAVIGLYVFGRVADCVKQLGWVVACALFGLGSCLLVSVLATDYGASLVLLICAGCFLFAPHAPFWAIPVRLFPPQSRGAAIGMISLVGNIGSFVGPYAMGYIREITGILHQRNADSGGYLAAALAARVRIDGTCFGRRRRLSVPAAAVHRVRA